MLPPDESRAPHPRRPHDSHTRARRRCTLSPWSPGLVRAFGFQAADHQVDAEAELLVHVAAAAEIHGQADQPVGRVAGHHLGDPGHPGQLVIRPLRFLAARQVGVADLGEGVRAEATCYKGHPAPAPECRCGIYGAVAGTHDSLPGYLRDTAYERDPWAYAEIACHGHVFADMRGVRAEYARLVRIALPGTGWPGKTAPGEASRMLRDRYSVPVGGAECVPEWLTANVRPGGAPPDGKSLNLELARLDLSCLGDRS